MKKLTFIIAFATTTILGHAQSIKDLDFLIGTWDIVETIYPGTDKEYQEKGVRVCEYYLDGTFIKCESSTIDQRNQRARHYVYFMNYAEKEKAFMVTSLAHDFPLHGQHKWFLDSEKKVLQAVSPINVIKDRFFRGTIDFSNSDKLVWNGWASKYTDDKEWKQIFNDVVTKRK